MREVDAMNKLIRIAVGCLALCGTLAVLPGIAQAREPERAAAAHVDRGHRGERGDRGRDHGRGHDRGRFDRDGRRCR
jgi:hypothetical protein